MSNNVEVGGARRSQGAVTSLVSWSKVLALGVSGKQKRKKKAGVRPNRL